MNQVEKSMLRINNNKVCRSIFITIENTDLYI